MPHVPLSRALPTALLLTAATSATATPLDLSQVVGLSLRELLEVEVTTVTRQEQPLKRAAAAVTVITAEEIRRSGADNIPDLLRSVPGAHVARVDGNTWAVSLRGFNGIWANRVHVLVDGRSVYNPLFGGVNWDTLDLPLDNIERIEVVRGPGGTLWGANSINGVINIITRSAAATQGDLAQLELRDPGAAAVTLRHGGQLANGAWWRVHGKLLEGDGPVDYDGREPRNGEHDGHFGARLDWDLDPDNRLRLEGEVGRGRNDQYQRATAPDRFGSFVIPDSDRFERYHLLAHWDRDLGERGRWSLQGYLQHDRREQSGGNYSIDTFDLDFQHHFRPHLDHQLSWGVGYRRVEDEVEGSYIIDILPHASDGDLFNAFLQDEITLAPTLRLTLGSKFEHNDRTGFEYQPSARLAWSPSEETTLWGAVTRAVRTPSRSHSDVVAHPLVLLQLFPFRLAPLTIAGSPEASSDVTVSWEAGVRRTLSEALTLDLAAYYNDHRSLYTFVPSATDPLRYVGTNDLDGHDAGIEVSAGWQVTPRWRLNLAYAYHQTAIDQPVASALPVGAFRAIDQAPAHLVSLRSYLDLAPNLELDGSLYFVDEPDGDGSDALDDPLRADLRLGWRPRKGLELSLTAQNLFDGSHQEFSTLQAISGQIPRTLFARATWHF
ncbi:TonB-dependent receptor plug domain-containing protein [Endothiovibrio diazotrophicus]